MANRWLPREVRFWAKVDKTGTCWLWTGAVTDRGYGQFCDNNKRLLAHRVSWEMSRGPIETGLTIDHLCLVKLCVNPAHLEPVSRGENSRRWANGLTHCVNGHPFNDENTYLDKGKYRVCRTCQRARWHKREASRRAKEDLND